MPLVKPPDIPIPPPLGKPGGLGEKLENALVRFLLRILNGAKELLSGVLRYGIDTFLEGVEPYLISTLRPYLTRIRNMSGMPPELRSLIDAALSGQSQAGTALLGFLGQGVGSATVGTVTSILLSDVVHWLNAIVRPQRPDVASLFFLLRRGVISEADYREVMGEIGWSEKWVAALNQINLPRPDILTLAQDTFRRNQPLATLRDELTRRGFSAPDIEKILNVLTPIPGPQDLIRFAVRDAWNESVVKRYGYDEDYPVQFGEWMQKQGFPLEWSRYYWRAHWDLPGPVMAREMLHRTSMTVGDYETLLKIADYPSAFRRWMTEIAYEPYTRVDIRRMYNIGVIKTYAELVRAYKDIGYDDTKASKLADFTVLEYGETEREATKTEVLAAYDIGRLSRVEATSYLQEMGYPDWVVEVYLARADLSRTVKLAKEAIGHVKTMYVNGQLTQGQVYTELGKVPLTGAEIARYLEEWEITRQAKVVRPSRADLRKWFLMNVMSEADFRTELRGFRLSDKYINWYVADAKRELVAKAIEDQEKAKAEAERVRREKVRNEFDIRAADLDVEIARLNLAKADLRASITDESTYEEIVEIGDLITMADREIKSLQYQKAKVRSEFMRQKAGG